MQCPLCKHLKPSTEEQPSHKACCLPVDDEVEKKKLLLFAEIDQCNQFILDTKEKLE